MQTSPVRERLFGVREIALQVHCAGWFFYSAGWFEGDCACEDGFIGGWKIERDDGGTLAQGFEEAGFERATFRADPPDLVDAAVGYGRKSGYMEHRSSLCAVERDGSGGR